MTNNKKIMKSSEWLHCNSWNLFYTSILGFAYTNQVKKSLIVEIQASFLPNMKKYQLQH